jgi:rubrerythrin
MKQFSFADEIIDFAIEREQEAVEFYTDLSGKMEQPSMRQVFLDFAEEEKRHKTKLEGIKDGKLLAPAEKKVKDLKIADYLVDVDAEKSLDYQQALILAMKKEKVAFKLYSNLAAATDDDNLRSTLLSLAQEEAKHKLRFELEYDEHFMREN